MKAVDIVVLLDALLMILMGVLGYVAPTTKQPSIMSLVAGVGIGVLLIGSLALAKTNPRAGRITAAVVAVLPLGRFLPAFLTTHAIYPAGIISCAALFTFAFLLGAHFMATSKKKKADAPV